MRWVAALVGAAVLVATPAHAAPRVSTLFTVQDPEISESSGLVDQGSTVLTTNDSGDGPTIFVLDAATGQTIGHTTYTTDAVMDVEALARGRNGAIWVGDIGDNEAVRGKVSVYRVGPVPPGERSVSAQRYDLAYKGGPRDAETLLVDPDNGRLFVVSKGLLGGQVFRAPKTLRTDRTNLLRPVGRVGGLVTDGEFTRDGDHVVLRDYSDAFIHAQQSWRLLGRWALPNQPQGEGLSVRPSGDRVTVSSEGAGQPVYDVRIPPRLRDAMRPSAASASATAGVPREGRGDGSGLSTPDMVGVAGLAAVVLAAGLGIRAALRRLSVRASRPRSRSTR